MKNLEQLRRRKAELKAQIEQQKEALKNTFGEIRQEVEPANLLKKAVAGMFAASKEPTSNASSSSFASLSQPLLLISNLFIRDPKWAFVVKLLGPLALRFLPKITDSVSANLQGSVAKDQPESTSTQKMKTKLYGSLRRGVSALRSHIKQSKSTEKQPNTPESPTA